MKFRWTFRRILLEMDFAENAGEHPGLAVWRIEKLAPVKVDHKHHGKFYEGDSYIVLKTK